MKNNEFKERKKAHRKALRKKVFWWKTGAIVTGILAGVVIPLNSILSMFDNTVAAFVGGSFWKLENPDETAQYFTGDFNSNEEMIEYGNNVIKQVELEGAALLKNDNFTLPLDSGKKVSLFSNSSVNLVYGGTGSGNVDASSADTLRKSFEDAGLVVNDKLWDFYLSDACKEYKRKGGSFTASVPVSEVPWSVYPSDVKDSFKNFGDAAFVVLSRVGGEGADLDYSLDGSKNNLALDANEREMMKQIKLLKDAGEIKKVVVLINSANALQVDFLKDNEYGVDACMWIGDLGCTGVNAIGELVTGKANPSGSLVDTYCYDNFSSPAMANSVPTTYKGYDGKNIPSDASTYMIYQEGIYVGYKYYETRYEDYVLNKGNAGNYKYSDDVAYPFGHGLSYTTFEYSEFNVSYIGGNRDKFYVYVKVTNTGEVPGKETVQIYAQQPYTQYDIDNGVEKASAQLVGFDKTEVLAPGENQVLTIEVDRRELAAYDTYGAKTYILDAGDYYLTAATDAHNAVNNILAKKGNTPQNTDGRMDALGNADLVHVYNNGEFDKTTYSKSLNGTEITNQLQTADINLYEGIKEGTKVTYLKRNNWVDTMPKADNVLQLELTERMIKDLQNVLYDAKDYEPVEMPKMGQPGNLKLYDMIGKDYDDPMWEELLNQVTFDEMVSLIGDAFHWTMPLKSIEAPGSRNENGPQGLTASLFGNNDKVTLKATALTSEDVMAATFNVDLVEEVGKVVGNNCLAANINVLYGPGNNTHRTPYGGRNFEYYSEDGFLSGVISSYEVRAIQAKGVHVVMKHFALNDSEQDRIGLGVWVNEQAAREIYLKAFQTPFEKGNANGVMTAYTRWGCIWSGAHKGLMTNIMRGEWGSNGLTITDNILTNYTNGVDAILAGVSIFDAMLPNIVNQLPQYKDDAVVVTAMRVATHRNLYALANSCGMNLVGPNTTIQPIGLAVLNVTGTLAIVLSVAFIGLLGMYIYSRIKFNKSEEHQDFLKYKKEHK